jgi:magnesium transporter
VSVPTMVAGIYGMNFDDMPWLHWHYGFATLLALTAVACLLLVRVFRRNQWL